MAEYSDDLVTAKNTQAWLLTLVEGMPQMIWRAVDIGLWTWSSPQWLHYTGQTTYDSSGKGWLKAIHPEDQNTAKECWEKAVITGEFHADLRIRGAAGQYKWFQTRAEPVRDGDKSIIEWIGTSTDVDDLRQLQSEQKVLVAELQHRTRNLIAVVHSIFLQTLKRTTTLSDFRDSFEDRLSALSRVQGLLSTSEHKPITIKQLLELELHALADGQYDEQVALSGSETVIRSSTVQTLALAVHELATNAIKHGALSQPNGRLKISWQESLKDSNPWLCLKWQETGISIIQSDTPKPPGYGRVLIEQALPRQLGANTRLEFGNDMMECVIDLPLKDSSDRDSHG